MDSPRFDGAHSDSLDQAVDIADNGQHRTPLSWYVVAVRQRSEAKAIEEIQASLTKAGRLDALGELYLPTQKTWVVERGQRKEIEEPVYPGYIMVEVRMDIDVVALVQSAPKVRSILGVDTKTDRLRPVASAEIQRIKDALLKGKGLSSGAVAGMYEVGDVVRIKDGGDVFDAMEGAVVEVDQKKMRLRVSVPILGKEATVAFNFDQVEKVKS